MAHSFRNSPIIAQRPRAILAVTVQRHTPIKISHQGRLAHPVRAHHRDTNPSGHAAPSVKHKVSKHNLPSLRSGDAGGGIADANAFKFRQPNI
ncbi:hypothetical protein Z950_3354 [Sulfitobacter mediterraneus KCTC 32188]|nr:hypothetical protein Z950_3354 [Sulfitobacter mediterraneus KCTC 32188]